MKKLLTLFVCMVFVSSLAMAGEMSVVGSFSGSSMGPGMRMGLGGGLSVQVDVGPLLGATGATAGAQAQVGYDVMKSADSTCALWAGVNVSNSGSTMTNSLMLNATHEVWLSKKLAIGILGNVVSMTGSVTTLFSGSSVYAVVAL